ncbi:MAG TPA: hypothetical protein VE860_04180 [Chthoniobacterales bacterium]|nr:hypothetical protein [Chthoniobacterales bacterium]
MSATINRRHVQILDYIESRDVTFSLEQPMARADPALPAKN